jgi:hypothetical protein
MRPWCRIRPPRGPSEWLGPARRSLPLLLAGPPSNCALLASYRPLLGNTVLPLRPRPSFHALEDAADDEQDHDHTNRKRVIS